MTTEGRFIVHATLKALDGVEGVSEGRGEGRRVVLVPTRQDRGGGGVLDR